MDVVGVVDVQSTVPVILPIRYYSYVPVGLNSASFWILTALASGRRHGYDILREVKDASDSRESLKVTTFYAALERLERDGLIEADGEEIVNGRVRRYFTLEDEGAAALMAEVELLERRTRVARERLVALRPASTRTATA